MKAFSLFALLCGISFSLPATGCAKGEKIVVLYRGRAAIDKTAQVIRDKTAIGFVEESFSEPGLQRVVLRLQQAKQASTNDRFVPIRDPSGKMGFRIFAGRDGTPLLNGAEIEADPSSVRRAQIAPDRPEAPPPHPRREDSPVQENPEERRGPASDEVRNEMMRRREERMQQNVGHLLTAGPATENMDQDLVRRFAELGRSLEGKSMEETRRLLEGDGQALQKELAAYAAEQQRNGNQTAGAEARQLVRRLELSIRRVSRFGDSRSDQDSPGGRRKRPFDNFNRRGEAGKD